MAWLGKARRGEGFNQMARHGRARLGRAARKVVGSLARVDIPGWESSESAAEWVRASRRGDDEKLARAWEEQ